MPSNTRPIGVLRYNAEVMRDNGAPKEFIEKYLTDNGSSFKQILAVPTPNEETLNRLLESEKSGKFAEGQQKIDDIDKNRRGFWGTLATKEGAKAAAQGFAEGLQYGTQRVANAATMGVYDWANTKLGGTAREDAKRIAQEVDKNGLGNLLLASNIMSEVGGAGISPLTQAVGAMGGAATKAISNPLAREVASGALTGGAFGGIRSGFDSDFNPLTTAEGAVLGGAIGGAIPLAKEGIKNAGKGIKAAVTGLKKGVEKTPFVGGVVTRSPEEMARGAQSISGALPDNGELTGTAVKNLADDVTRDVKTKAAALYDKAEKLASGRPVVLDKNSNLSKAFTKLAENATKSGRSELNKVWNEVGHTKYDAPTYETAKSFRSWLSEKSATGGTGLTKKQYGDLLEALDRDIEASLGKEAAAAKKAADAFYRHEMGNPDSITNSVNKLLRKDPVSVVGNRAVASAQGKAWKASPLQKLINEGERIGSPYVADVKQGLQANTTTRAQFNRMSPEQKLMVYGDKLRAADKNFNGGLLNRTELALHKGTDVVLTPIEKVLQALSPSAGKIGGIAVSATRGAKQDYNKPIIKALGY